LLGGKKVHPRRQNPGYAYDPYPGDRIDRMGDHDETSPSIV